MDGREKSKEESVVGSFAYKGIPGFMVTTFLEKFIQDRKVVWFYGRWRDYYYAEQVDWRI